MSTHGDAAIGVALAVNEFGIGIAVDGTVENHGSIVADGAVGVLMIGSGHHLVNSGRIVADGGTFNSDLTGELRAAVVSRYRETTHSLKMPGRGPSRARTPHQPRSR